MNVEVINTGTELLLGSVMNTHLAYFAKTLFPIGLRVQRQVAVPDGEPIRTALAEALGRASVVLVTGGLGPTTDDVTRETAAELLGRPLVFHAEVLEAIRERFKRVGAKMTARVERQARAPQGAVILTNENGTAPGLYLECQDPGLTGGRLVHLFLLPGPPRELQPMFENWVVPALRDVAPRGAGQACRVWQVLGVGESSVEAAVGDALLAIPGLELGYCARPGEVDVRCIGPQAALDAAEQIITAALGDRIVSRDGRPLEQFLVEELAARQETLATAESCTGGSIANRITNVPGASTVFLAGYVTYSNDAKSLDLGVNPITIETNGAVSAEVATAMAEGACRRSGADWAIATTGIAGPGGGSEAKPRGTIFIAVAQQGRPTHVEKHLFVRDREGFKQLATQTALDILRRRLV